MPRPAEILRRTRRAAGIAATIGSAVLAVGVLAAWGTSFRRPLLAAFDGRGGERCRVVVHHGRATADNAPQVDADETEGLAHWHAAFIAFDRLRQASDNQRDAVAAEFYAERKATQAMLNAHPAWSRTLPPYAPPLAAVVFAAAPAFAARRRLRLGHRRRAGLCLACGYDCRATPGRCPECGSESKDGGAGSRGWRG